MVFYCDHIHKIIYTVNLDHKAINKIRLIITIKFLLCYLETDISAPDLPLSENVAYATAHVETCSYSETYDFMDKIIKTPEPDYATVTAGKHNTITFPFGCFIGRQTTLHASCVITAHFYSNHMKRIWLAKAV